MLDDEYDHRDADDIYALEERNMRTKVKYQQLKLDVHQRHGTLIQGTDAESEEQQQQNGNPLSIYTDVEEHFYEDEHDPELRYNRRKLLKEMDVGNIKTHIRREQSRDYILRKHHEEVEKKKIDGTHILDTVKNAIEARTPDDTNNIGKRDNAFFEALRLELSDETYHPTLLQRWATNTSMAQHGWDRDGRCDADAHADMKALVSLCERDSVFNEMRSQAKGFLLYNISKSEAEWNATVQKLGFKLVFQTHNISVIMRSAYYVILIGFEKMMVDASGGDASADERAAPLYTWKGMKIIKGPAQ